MSDILKGELIPRDVYICEIYKIPMAVNKMKSGNGLGFYWILKIMKGIYKDREIFDYFPIKWFNNKKINFDKLVKVMKQLNIKTLNTSKLQVFEGQIIPVLISVRKNKQGKRENFVEDYLIQDISNIK